MSSEGMLRLCRLHAARTDVLEQEWATVFYKPAWINCFSVILELFRVVTLEGSLEVLYFSVNMFLYSRPNKACPEFQIVRPLFGKSVKTVACGSNYTCVLTPQGWIKDEVIHAVYSIPLNT